MNTTSLHGGPALRPGGLKWCFRGVSSNITVTVIHVIQSCASLCLQGGGVRGQRSGVCRLLSHSSKANLVPVLTRSTSGPLAGARLMSTARGSVESLRAPSLETCNTLETQQEVKGRRWSQYSSWLTWCRLWVEVIHHSAQLSACY